MPLCGVGVGGIQLYSSGFGGVSISSSPTQIERMSLRYTTTNNVQVRSPTVAQECRSSNEPDPRFSIRTLPSDHSGVFKLKYSSECTGTQRRSRRCGTGIPIQTSGSARQTLSPGGFVVVKEEAAFAQEEKRRDLDSGARIRSRL